MAGLRALNATPHVAQNTSNRRSAIDNRTTRHPGYRISQVIRKRVEEIFGWIKQIGGQRKTRFRGLERVRWNFILALAGYDLVRLPKILKFQLEIERDREKLSHTASNPC